MSTLNMCEREGCETLIKGKALGAVTLIYTTDQEVSMSRDGSNVKRLELCPACVEDIHNVIMYAPITKRDKGYSKPFDPRVTEVETDLSNVDTEHMMAVLMQRVMQTKSIQSGDSE